MVAQALCHFRI